MSAWPGWGALEPAGTAQGDRPHEVDAGCSDSGRGAESGWHLAHEAEAWHSEADTKAASEERE
jgi:hypothetical protein